jgi:hypothetical protein
MNRAFSAGVLHCLNSWGVAPGCIDRRAVGAEDSIDPGYNA